MALLSLYLPFPSKLFTPVDKTPGTCLTAELVTEDENKYA